ncbi:GATA transcription factor 9 [Heracleum sosnowskyi]|uniref:GATA transcription factor 9 n=1 Tax=Heracleum sosnowskyi TaxID=360622 RepID=A0AAD8J4N0_9APIA|nr:GATA transcription factor 9 [Heracleum sosnowskyi]
MDFCRNVTLSGDLPSEHEPEHPFSSSCTTPGSLDDIFSGNTTMQEEDINSEWLSMFVEDCLSNSGNCLPPPPPVSSTLPLHTVEENSSTVLEQPATGSATRPLLKPPGTTTCSLTSPILHNEFVVPGKARSKRSRVPCKDARKRIRWSNGVERESPDPPLLHQAYWLADSELILPKYEGKNIAKEGNMNMNMIDVEKVMGSFEGLKGQQQQQQPSPRRCSHCLSQKTPQWRSGPSGPKTLCNACGVRYKSGRLLPEYRPAKSPTFVSYMHSNSHKKVLEMRTMSVLSSSNGD